jgi:hypothetical protein
MRTRNLIYVLAVCAMILSITNAKAGGAENKLGITAGVNMAGIAGDNSGDYSTKTGFNAGVVMDLGMSENLSINVSALYSQMGAQSKDNSSNKWNLNYFTIPILAKYKLSSGLNFFAGPYIGFLMSADAKSDAGSIDLKDNMESTDFGLHVGVGFQLEGGLGFNARYGLGFSNIDKSGGSNTNNLIAINVSYMFGGK